MGGDYGSYDVIVVGAGHAGCEAGLAAARMGLSALMVTGSIEAVALMPCNPSVGGPAKAHLVREVDALGGEIGLVTDMSYLQLRMLNTSKGPAVRSLRAQVDKEVYQANMKAVLKRQENLILLEGIVVAVTVRGGRAAGVVFEDGGTAAAKAVVLTTGTYLGGKTFVGTEGKESGPQGLFSSTALSRSLAELGFEFARFKTGTSPRIWKGSIDFDEMEIQPGDDLKWGFSFEGPLKRKKSVPSWLTYTNAGVHEIIAANLGRSALFSGCIVGTGPRYCPSIETKIVRFPERGRHQVFIEPETEHGELMYLAGLSTSLPLDAQIEMVRAIPGLRRAEIARPGYAIEYDCIVSTQLKHTLETKLVSGLFTAGQLNGSSGYEEAAAQGIVAGINAALYAQGREGLIIDRSQGYIGVLIDDLTTKGTNEPYRMLTSRSEYRLLLRQDNADARLTPVGRRVGLISDERYERFMAKRRAIEEEVERLKGVWLSASEDTARKLADIGTSGISVRTSLAELLRRPEVTYGGLAPLDPERPELADDVVDEVEIEVKYEGYIARQAQQVERFRRLESKKIPEWFDYRKCKGLSAEAVEKLSRLRPASVGEASRVSGVSPADVGVLLMYLEGSRRGGA